MDSEGEEIELPSDYDYDDEDDFVNQVTYDEVDTPSYRTRLKQFVDRYMTEHCCKIVYEVLSYLYENYVF